MVTDDRLLLSKEPTPIYEHDCDKCVFLGNYDGHDLYYCPAGVRGTVIARFSGGGPDYSSGLPFGRRPLGYFKGANIPHLRVAYLIAADLGYVPFTWGDSLEVSPEQCQREGG